MSMVKNFKKCLAMIPVWIPTILILAVICWLTLAGHPAGDIEIPLFPGADKIGHALMFGALAFAAELDWMHARHWRPLPLPAVAAVAIGTSAIGIAIEFLQRAMPTGRSFEIADMLADAFGAVLVSALWIMLQPLLEQSDRHKD